MSGEYREYLANNMTPEQRANAEELYNELRKFAEPPNDPFENMPKALIENVDLRAQVAALQTAPDAIQAQARVAELEQALSEIEALTATESPMTYQWVLRVMRKVNAIARSARVGGGA